MCVCACAEWQANSAHESQQAGALDWINDGNESASHAANGSAGNKSLGQQRRYGSDWWLGADVRMHSLIGGRWVRAIRTAATRHWPRANTCTRWLAEVFSCATARSCAYRKRSTDASTGAVRVRKVKKTMKQNQMVQLVMAVNTMVAVGGEPRKRGSRVCQRQMRPIPAAGIGQLLLAIGKSNLFRNPPESHSQPPIRVSSSNKASGGNVVATVPLDKRRNSVRSSRPNRPCGSSQRTGGRVDVFSRHVSLRFRPSFTGSCYSIRRSGTAWTFRLVWLSFLVCLKPKNCQWIGWRLLSALSVFIGVGFLLLPAVVLATGCRLTGPNPPSLMNRLEMDGNA